MYQILLIALWAAPLWAGTQVLLSGGEIAAPRFAEGDLDGDGRAELVIGGRVGPFQPVTDPLAGRRARIEVQVAAEGRLRTMAFSDELPVVADLAVGDVDGDGRAEVLAVGWYRLWTLRLEEGALVVVGQESLAEGRLARIDAADLDGDGRAEVVLAERLRAPGAEVATTALAVYRYAAGWDEIARMEVAGDVGDLCLGTVRDQPTLALEVGGEEIGGLVQQYVFDGLSPRLRARQQITRDHVRALHMDLSNTAGRPLLAVGDIRGHIALLEPRGDRWVEVGAVASPGGPLRGVHLTGLLGEGIQLLGGGLRGAVWMADGF